MKLRLVARFVLGAARQTIRAWREDRLGWSPLQWLRQARDYCRNFSPAPSAALGADGSAARSDEGRLGEYARVRDPATPRFLVITDVLPTADRDSGLFRLLQILRILRDMGYEVTLAVDAPDAPPEYAAQVRDLGVSIQLGYEAVIRHLAEEGLSYRYVLLSRPDVAFRYLFPVRAYAIYAEVVYDTVDLHSVRFRRAGEMAGDQKLLDQAEHYRRMEHFNAASADMTIAVTSVEQETVRQEVPEARVEVIPNIHPAVNHSSDWQSRNGVMFIGSFWHAPNEDAVRYFATEILPLVSAVVPDLNFFIVGSYMPDSVRALASESVHTVGHVPDPGPYFSRCRVFVSPLRYGAGMKGKLGQSMSYGLPVVTTSVGAEGMMLVDGDHALIADAAEEFAQAVIRLHTNRGLWEHIATNSRAHVSRHFSDVAARDRLQRLFPLTGVTNVQ